jgi:hypothetical protein
MEFPGICIISYQGLSVIERGKEIQLAKNCHRQTFCLTQKLCPVIKERGFGVGHTRSYINDFSSREKVE